jgi:hypothetical protein
MVGAFPKVCRRCGRCGTGQFIESGRGDNAGAWECANDRACRQRAKALDDTGTTPQADAAIHRAPTGRWRDSTAPSPANTTPKPNGARP